MPEIPTPSIEWYGLQFLGGQPRLGIDAEDLSGQLGAFFAAPMGEGILGRECQLRSASEKGRREAGDVSSR